MKKLYWSLLLLSILISHVRNQVSADEGWSHYYHKQTNNIAVDEENVWCSHQSGVLMWRKDGSSYKNYYYEFGNNVGKAYDVKIDSDGVVWITSPLGAAYFENNTWHEFQIPETPTGHPYYALLVDSSDTKWFGSFKYITSFDGETWQSYELEGTVREVESDQQGNIWIATSAGASKFENGAWKHFTVEDGLAGTSLDDIEIDEANTAWFGTRGGLTSFDGENWETITTREAKAVAAGKDGTIWMAVSYSDSTGVFSYDGENWVYYEQMAGQKAIDIYEDDDGTIWCATRESLYKKEGENWVAFQADDGMPDVFLSGVATAKNGDLWVATTNVGTHYLPMYPSGVFRYDGYTWQQFTTDDGLLDNDVIRMTVDPNDNVWCGYHFGLSRYDGSSWYTWHYPDISSEIVQAISFNRDGNGCFEYISNFVCYDATSNKMVNHTDFTALNQINYGVIALDDNNIVWLGAKDGIYKQDGEEWIFYADPFPHTKGISSLSFDLDGALWAGTYDSGARRFDGQNWELYNTDNGLISNDLRNIIIDEQGVKWFVTGQGINRFDGTQWDKLDYANSPVSHIQSVSIDNDNKIWMCSFEDIYSYDGFVTPVSVTSQPISVLPLISSFPNPFNMSTSIEFVLQSEEIVTLSLYSASGQKIRTLLSDSFPQGRHTVRWDGLDKSGRPVSSGVYIAGLKTGNRTATQRMTLVK